MEILQEENFLRKKKIDRYFVCNKKGYFSKNCPQKQKFVKLIQHIQQISGLTLPDSDDVKSLFSLDDDATLKTLFAFQQEELDPDKTGSKTDLIEVGDFIPNLSKYAAPIVQDA